MEEMTNVTVEVTARNFDITSYARAKDKMIATNANTYQNIGNYHRSLNIGGDYTLDEIKSIIEHGNLEQQQRLSRYFFYRDGYYKQIIIHYATLLKYMGLLIPNPTFGKKLSTSHINKRYYSALDYVDCLSLPVFFTNCA